jgi:hypothetical protein
MLCNSLIIYFHSFYSYVSILALIHSFRWNYTPFLYENCKIQINFMSSSDFLYKRRQIFEDFRNKYIKEYKKLNVTILYYFKHPLANYQWMFEKMLRW